jgi:hypothetical protein
MHADVMPLADTSMDVVLHGGALVDTDVCFLLDYDADLTSHGGATDSQADDELDINVDVVLYGGADASELHLQQFRALSFDFSDLSLPFSFYFSSLRLYDFPLFHFNLMVSLPIPIFSRALFLVLIFDLPAYVSLLQASQPVSTTPPSTAQTVFSLNAPCHSRPFASLAFDRYLPIPLQLEVPLIRLPASESLMGGFATANARERPHLKPVAVDVSMDVFGGEAIGFPRPWAPARDAMPAAGVYRHSSSGGVVTLVAGVLDLRAAVVSDGGAELSDVLDRFLPRCPRMFKFIFWQMLKWDEALGNEHSAAAPAEIKQYLTSESESSSPNHCITTFTSNSTSTDGISGGSTFLGGSTIPTLTSSILPSNPSVFVAGILLTVYCVTIPRSRTSGTPPLAITA